MKLYPFWGMLTVLIFSCQQRTPLATEIFKYDFDPIKSRIQSWVDQGYYPGASILISKDGQVIYEDYFGRYDSTQVVYIASAGKWLASATIASVVESTNLSWEDSVSRWLPQFTDVKGTATLRELMSHTSGYPDYQPGGAHPDDYQTLKESVAQIVPLKTDTFPGAEFHYGGLAMQVAGRMAERATGQDFEMLFQKHIAAPLDMKNTHFTPVDPTNGHNPMVGGGARSTLHDYAHFLEMILNEGRYKGQQVLAPKTIAVIESDQINGINTDKDDFVKPVRQAVHNGIYGLGVWREELNEDGVATLLSSPSWAGAYPWVDRANNMTGILLTHVVPEVAFTQGFSSFHASPVLATMTRAIIHQDPELATGFAPIEGGQLYYEFKGNGPAVILLHGHSLDTRMWEQQFDAFSSDFRVIRYDMRGYGKSAEPDSGQQFMHVKDLLGLMDHLKIEKAHLVGLSLGAFVVGDMLARYPGRVNFAVMASGGVYDHSGPSIPFSRQEIAQRKREMEDLKKSGVLAYKKRWYNEMINETGSNGEEIRKPLWEMIYQWTAWQPLHIEPRLLLGNDVLQQSERIDNSVLFIYGELDSGGSHRSMNRMKDIIPNAISFWIPDAGHMCNMEQPLVFNKAVFDFLKPVSE